MAMESPNIKRCGSETRKEAEMASKTVIVDKQGAVGILRLNRPEKRNAMSALLIDEAINLYLCFSTVLERGECFAPHLHFACQNEEVLQVSFQKQTFKLVSKRVMWSSCDV